nr:guanine deaminase [Candidatus Cloacimonadota bacterium]
MIHIRSNFFNPISVSETAFLEDHVITIDQGKIQSIVPFTQHHGAWEDHRNHIVLPGLIDLHVHLSQFRIRGLYEPALLPWLEKNVFPEESRSQNPDFARQLSRDFFSDLLRKGTTFSVIYTAPYREAADAAFEVAQEMGIRCLIGMTMMDMNAPDALLQTTDYALKNSVELYEKWNGSDLGFIFTPRFAPTCSESLMRETGSYAAKHKAFIQTHLSENLDEIAWVKDIFGKENYTKVYDSFGLLGPRTILGHAIHLSDQELDILSDTKTCIAHCPDSNFYLKSGEFALRKVSEHGIPFGLGSDVGAGTTLNMLSHAKYMNYRQSNDPILAAEMLYRVSLGNAKILSLQERIGSLDPGKDADLIFLEPPQGFPINTASLAQAFFLQDDFTIRRVMTLGRDRSVLAN